MAIIWPSLSFMWHVHSTEVVGGVCPEILLLAFSFISGNVHSLFVPRKATEECREGARERERGREEGRQGERGSEKQGERERDWEEGWGRERARDRENERARERERVVGGGCLELLFLALLAHDWVHLLFLLLHCLYLPPKLTDC